MENLSAGSLKVEGNTLKLLDQTQLPLREEWLSCPTIEALYGAITALKVRGAPLIGIASALFVALEAEGGASDAQLHAAIDRLLTSRPTAVNLSRNLAAMRAAIPSGTAALVATATELFTAEGDMCQALATAGQQVVAPRPGEPSRDKVKILTLCNTGSLATIGIGTAIGVITEAAKAGRVEQVWVSETRPLLQGGRLTAYEMVKGAIPHQIITDSMAATLMAAGEVDLVVVGADRIAVNGDVANKIGTYALAVCSHHHGVPFYVAAPSTTYDPSCACGADIPIEQRDPAEVKGFRFDPGNPEAQKIRWSPEASAVFNPAFDVTPAALISGYILPRGVAYNPQQMRALLG